MWPAFSPATCHLSAICLIDLLPLLYSLPSCPSPSPSHSVVLPGTSLRASARSLLMPKPKLCGGWHHHGHGTGVWHGASNVKETHWHFCAGERKTSLRAFVCLSCFVFVFYFNFSLFYIPTTYAAFSTTLFYCV